MSLMNATTIAINIAWLIPPGDWRAFDHSFSRVEYQLLNDPVSNAWFAEHVDHPNEWQYLEVNEVDGKQRRKTVKRDRQPGTREVRYPVEVTRLEQAEDLDEEFRSIIREIYTLWAVEKGVPAPPF